MVSIFVPDVPEFTSLLYAASTMPGCTVARHADAYFKITADGVLEFRRKALGVKPAIWYGLFTGGIDGVIEQFDRDVVRIVDAASAA